MRKILFGISLILFSIAMCLLGEIGQVSFLRNDFSQFVCVLLPLIGLGMSAWGFFDNDSRKNN